MSSLHFVREPIEGPAFVPARAELENLRRGATSPALLSAIFKLCETLRARGVRFAVTGGVAINVYGWPRSTRDIDILIGPEAFSTSPDGTQALVVDLPHTLEGFPVDYLPIDVAGEFLTRALDEPFVTETVPIAPVEAVICTKLLRFAMRDQADVVEILKAGLFESAAVESYLAEHAPMLLGRFRNLVDQARREQPSK